MTYANADELDASIVANAVRRVAAQIGICWQHRPSRLLSACL